MPVASTGEVELAYEVVGYEDDPALVLIAGLGNQMYFFEDEFVQGLVDRAFRVVRFDNRDAGLSTSFDAQVVDLGALLGARNDGADFVPPYRVSDMALDVVGLLDHLAIERAHLFGVSLGGMIAQSVAIGHPTRVQSLTLLSSTTGSPDVGQPSAEALAALLNPATPAGRDAIVEADVQARRIWATADHFDEAWTRQYFEEAYDRSYGPSRVTRQMAAVLSEPSREPVLAGLQVPTLVLHGSDDKLINVSGGARLAEVIPAAEFVELEGMGHDLLPHYWAPIIEAVTQLAIRSA